MNLAEILSEAIAAIRMHKLRSVLTTLGIVIGVLTVISMQTFIEGLNNKVTGELSELGANAFFVQKYPAVTFDISKFRNRQNLTLEQAEAINERARLVSLVAPEHFKFPAVVKHDRRKTNPEIFLIGGTSAWQETNSFFVEEGRFLSRIDVSRRRSVCVLGIDIVEKLFPFERAIGKKVLIDGQRFQVVGVFEEKGSFFGQNRDNVALIPITTFEKIYGEKRSLQIGLKAVRPEFLQAAMDEVTGILRVERGVPPGTPNDFEVMTRDSLMDTWRELTKIIFSAAIGICAISLLVGGIGVMNIMLVSVTERTREIGIRKAVGAKRRDIMIQFLVEAIFICQIGGLIGVALGLGLGKIIGSMTTLPAAVPLWSIFLGIGFVSLVGVFFGFYPAAKAAKLRPVTALSYE